MSTYWDIIKNKSTDTDFYIFLDDENLLDEEFIAEQIYIEYSKTYSIHYYHGKQGENYFKELVLNIS